LWRPGNSFWSPENVQQVWARGLETSWELEKTLPHGKFNLLLRYHYTRSTIEKAYEANSSNEGNQLIYTPTHTGSAHFSFRYGALKLTWQQQYNGQVYTTNSNTSTLPGFMLANFLTSYTFKHNWVEVDLQAQVYNLANKTYEVIEWRPMPGRNYQFGIIIKPNFNF
jgi:iron complex outermembrane receptor protein